MENPIRLDDLGGPPLFLETPIYHITGDQVEVIPFIGMKHATKLIICHSSTPPNLPGRDVRLQHLLDHAVENTGAWTSRPGNSRLGN